MVWANDSLDETFKPDSWIKSNPLLGVQSEQKNLMKGLTDKRSSNLLGGTIANFQTKNINMWLQQDVDSFLKLAEVEKAVISSFEVYARRCYVGTDYSLMSDNTAIAFVYPYQDEQGNAKWHIEQHSFVPWHKADALRLGVAGNKQFLDRVKALTGVALLIYMSESTAHQFDWSSVSTNYGLWAGQYGSTEPTGYQSDPWLDNTGWGVWSNGPAIYQYSSNGHLPGYGGALDLDIAFMDKATWNKYVGIVGEIKNVPAPTSVVATSAIEQFNQVGGRYTAYNPIHVDAVKLVNGI